MLGLLACLNSRVTESTSCCTKVTVLVKVLFTHLTDCSNSRLKASDSKRRESKRTESRPTHGRRPLLVLFDLCSNATRKRHVVLFPRQCTLSGRHTMRPTWSSRIDFRMLVVQGGTRLCSL